MIFSEIVGFWVSPAEEFSGFVSTGFVAGLGISEIVEFSVSVAEEFSVFVWAELVPELGFSETVGFSASTAGESVFVSTGFVAGLGLEEIVEFSVSVAEEFSVFVWAELVPELGFSEQSDFRLLLRENLFLSATGFVRELELEEIVGIFSFCRLRSFPFLSQQDLSGIGISGNCRIFGFYCGRICFCLNRICPRLGIREIVGFSVSVAEEFSVFVSAELVRELGFSETVGFSVLWARNLFLSQQDLSERIGIRGNCRIFSFCR
jgi:hypothetical protein